MIQSNAPSARTAWVAGASGLVGRHLVLQLCANPGYRNVVAFVRKHSNAAYLNTAKVMQHVVNFDDLRAPADLPEVDDLYCALGTTKAKTPDADDYYRIDVSYPLHFAELGLKHRATSYALVSAHGANPSSFSAYLKMKGELEQKLNELDYKKLVIARPGLLKGERDEFRLLERMSEYITNCLPGNYRSIHARDVAASLIEHTLDSTSGTTYLASRKMQGAFQS